MQTPTDELDFWEHARSSRSLDGDLVHGVFSVLEPLRETFGDFDSLPWVEAAEFVDQVRDALDSCWKVEGRNRSKAWGANAPFGSVHILHGCILVTN